MKRNTDASINWFLFIGILLIASNLRAPITSVGVTLHSIKETFSLSNGLLSIIAVIPLVAFAIISLFASKIGEIFGMNRTLFVALIFIFVGIILRSITILPFLYIGTILIGIGIAFGNVLTPGVIKSNFPLRIGIMTAYYTVVMNIFGSLSSFVTSPILKVSNYNIALGIIGLITLLTIFIWAFQLKHNQKSNNLHMINNTNVWKHSIAWQITLLMGSQSLIFYSLINWLPQYLLTYDISSDLAGLYLAILQLAIIPLTFITPIIVTKMKSQIGVTIFTGTLFIAGILIMMFMPQMSLYSLIIIGIASGIAFGLVNTFFSLRTKDGITAAKLSGMAQAIGYSFASLGPLLFGVLHDISGSWTPSLIVLLIAAVLITIISSGAGRNMQI
ncbi:MFS transporter [Staphylococcus aureus]|uniref:CynX/NimT family MFS transporter n=1 Tax=Staphylococcus aureus TaxID=1280 RepID=UPI002026B9E3|nr:MFS transporter [Staphylococcus aureus]MCL9691538.1 MFS transporter [Staphylococcus aureus]UXT39639.1 MFS transporter [Staphylococcus aureus]UXU38070.1 MFS transporter [Staphylococcus aureus]UXV54440.1 MFS transporter [Staphylococcus aureus]